jgi:sensor c-di-GMP phosphodiesterase-like protein
MADEDFITPDFAEPQMGKARSHGNRRAPQVSQQNKQKFQQSSQNTSSQGFQNPQTSTGSFFQENKIMIIIAAVALVVILVLVFWVMTREKKSDVSKRPPPGNQNMPPGNQNMPPPGHPAYQQMSGVPRGTAQPPGYVGNPNMQQLAPQPGQVPLPQTGSVVVPVDAKVAKKVSKPVQQESVIETADDNEVNKFMNIGSNNDEPLSSDEEEVVQKKDNVGDFDNLEQYDSDGDD